MNQFQTSDGTKIAFQYVEDHSPTLVLIHGAYITSNEWQPQKEILEQQSHVLVDLRGHGLSERKGYPSSASLRMMSKN